MVLDVGVGWRKKIIKGLSQRDERWTSLFETSVDAVALVIFYLLLTILLTADGGDDANEPECCDPSSLDHVCSDPPLPGGGMCPQQSKSEKQSRSKSSTAAECE